MRAQGMGGAVLVLFSGMTGGLIGLAVALIVATAAGLVLRWRSGRFRVVASAQSAVPLSTAPAASADPGVQSPASTGSGSAGLGAAGRSPAAAGGAVAGVLTEEDLGAGLGERATLVQFSTVFCAPCRPTRQILAQVADMVDGVKHIDIDAAERLDLVRRLRISSTPTVLVLGPAGEIIRRATGQPRKADVIAALGQVIESA